jgi:hypothetical protein
MTRLIKAEGVRTLGFFIFKPEFPSEDLMFFPQKNIQLAKFCIEFPKNPTEKFLLYPALAVYALTDRSIKTVVGCIFTTLSLMKLGLYPPINNVANWTRNSRNLLTISLQTFGNILELHSEVLTNYHTTYTPLYQKNLDRIEKEGIGWCMEHLTDIWINKVENACTKIFQNRTASKNDLIAKHIKLIFNLIFSFHPN